MSFLLMTLGIDLPRISKSGKPLPNARLVSYTIHTDEDEPSKIHTLLFMLLGQFTDHDMSRTAISKLSVMDDGKWKRRPHIDGFMKRYVTPLRQQWCYISFALSHRNRPAKPFKSTRIPNGSYWPAAHSGLQQSARPHSSLRRRREVI